jgi:hypothetical protein
MKATEANGHIDWLDISVEVPVRPGLYLICHPNPTYDEPWFDSSAWYAKGDRIYLERPGGMSEMDMLESIIYDEFTFIVPHAGFWCSDGNRAWELTVITHWAFIPNLPTGYKRSEEIP